MKFVVIFSILGVGVIFFAGFVFFQGFFATGPSPYKAPMSQEKDASNPKTSPGVDEGNTANETNRFFDLDISKLSGLPSTDKNDVFEIFYDTYRAKAVVKFRDDRDFICDAASSSCIPDDSINRASLKAKKVWYAWNSQDKKLGGIECQAFEGGCLTKSPAAIYDLATETLGTFDYSGEALGNSFSPSVKKFLSFDYDGSKALLYNLQGKPALEKQIDIKGTIGARSGGSVSAIAWNGDESKAAIAVDSYPAAIFLMDLDKNEIKLLFEDDRANFDWNRVDFTADGGKIFFSAGEDYKWVGQKAVNIESGQISTAEVQYKSLWGGNAYNAYYRIPAAGLEVGEADDSWLAYAMQKPALTFKYPPLLKPCAGTAPGVVVGFARAENDCNDDTAAMAIKNLGPASGFASVSQMNEAIKANAGSDTQFLPNDASYSDIDSSETIDINGREALKVQQINQFFGEGYWVIYFFDRGELFAIYNYKQGILDTVSFGSL